MKFDEILVSIGEFGTYQKRVYFLLCLPALLCGAQVLSTVFIMAIPPYRCSLPNYPSDSFSVQSKLHQWLINVTVPVGEDIEQNPYSECTLYNDVNVSVAMEQFNSQDNLTDFPQNSTTRHQKECNKWVYDRSEYIDTAITEFDLVCEKKIVRSHSNSAQFGGALFGSILMGIIADVLGRKKAILLSVLIHTLTTLVITFTPSFELMIAMRCLLGISTHSLFAISATTGIELVGPSKRTFTGMVIEFFWSAGCLLVLPVAYFIQQWRYIQLFLCLLGVPLYALWWLIPESPRWLLDKGKFQETETILDKICASNNTKLPAGAVGVDTADEGPQAKIWEMFTHRVLIVRFCIVFLNWLAVNMIFYGLSLNIENLAGSTYINFLLITFVEVFAYLAALLLLDRTGRRNLHCISMIGSGLASLAVILPTIIGGSEHQWIVTTLAVISKFFASSGFAILYIMSSELFPTVLRNSGIGVCSIFENLGGMISTYVADLGILVGGSFAPALPMLVFGCLGLSAGLLSLLLPETLHRTLPETIQDAIDFDKQPKVQKRTSPTIYDADLELKSPLSRSNNL